ncbi:MAG TPA: MBL fold metallo-hydrolase [Streptosporangiaceae bacterium]|nr:MBL fold metallo-hydrolase [Streptosporangiaceae bacterium]
MARRIGDNVDDSALDAEGVGEEADDSQLDGVDDEGDDEELGEDELDDAMVDEVDDDEADEDEDEFGSDEDVRIERVRHADSGCNTWLIGDDEEVIVVDPGTDAAAVLAAAGDREVLAVICTHGHRTHVAAALDVADRDEAPVALHPADLVLWREVHSDDDPAIDMEEGGLFEVAGVTLEVVHTPGHSAGSASIYCEDLGVVFTGDALLADGPGPHENEFPNFSEQLSAIGEELLTLPGNTRVLPGHGEESKVSAAEKRFDGWVSAGPVIADPTE